MSKAKLVRKKCRGQKEERKSDESCQDEFREEMTETSEKQKIVDHRILDNIQYIVQIIYCPKGIVSTEEWDCMRWWYDEVRHLSRQQVHCTWQKACGTLPGGWWMLIRSLSVSAREEWSWISGHCCYWTFSIEHFPCSNSNIPLNPFTVRI